MTTPLSTLDEGVYVSTYAHLVALDPVTGRPTWREAYRGVGSPLAEADGILYGLGFTDRGGFQAFAIRLPTGPTEGQQ